MEKTNRLSRRGFMGLTACAVGLAALPAGSMTDVNTLKIEGDEMTTLTPYLLLDGNCEQAMTFYRSCFGGELTITKVKDSPAKDHMPPQQQEKVLNARLTSGKLQVSASDWLRPDRTPVRGNTVCLYLSGASFGELKALFEKLSAGAEVTDPLSEQFFGAYGALNDKFGVRWMFHSDNRA